MIAKSSLLVFNKGDDLAIVTFEKVTIAKSSHLFPQTLPQFQMQTQVKKTHTLCMLNFSDLHANYPHRDVFLADFLVKIRHGRSGNLYYLNSFQILEKR